MPVTPKDAAAIILLKDQSDPKVFWVKRSPKMNVFGGFHSFPGGQLDKEDSDLTVIECEAGDPATMRACAVREFFEETGVLLARGVERLSAEQIRQKRRLLREGSTHGFSWRGSPKIRKLLLKRASLKKASGFARAKHSSDGSAAK